MQFRLFSSSDGLLSSRGKVAEEWLVSIGEELAGFVVQSAAIKHLAQVPIEQLDENDVTDAAGMRKIQELTSAQNAKRRQLEMEERKAARNHEIESNKS